MDGRVKKGMISLPIVDRQRRSSAADSGSAATQYSLPIQKSAATQFPLSILIGSDAVFAADTEIGSDPVSLPIP